MIRLNKFVFAVFFLLLSLPLLQAAEDSDFDINSFTDMALKELSLEQNFLSDLTEKPETLNTFMSVFPVVYNDELPKMDTNRHKEGISYLLQCIATEGRNEGAEKTWDKIINAGTDPYLDCGARDRSSSEAACIARASSASFSEIKEVEHSNCYNPVVAVLIRTYKLKSSTSHDALDERVANYLWASAQNRPRLGESLLDLSRLKYRYGRDPELKLYTAETQLTDDDKKGIAIMAQCLRDNAPMKQIVLYASRGEMPSEEFMRSPGMTCLNAVENHQSLSKAKLEENFARLGKAAMGFNLFTARQYAGVPSVLYPVFKAKTPAERQKAVAEVYAIDDFVNKQAQGLRDGFEKQQSFKGVSRMKAGERIILADVLSKRFMKENEGSFKEVKIWKAVAAGATSCVMGDDWKDNVKLQIVGVVLNYASKFPTLKAGAFVGTLVLTGFMVWGTYNSAEKLITSYKEMPLNELISETCNVAQGVQGIAGLKGLTNKEGDVVAELQESRRLAEGTTTVTADGKTKTVVPDASSVKPDSKSSSVETIVQPPTETTQKTDAHLTAAAENPAKAAVNWAIQFIFGNEKPSAAVRQKTQVALERQKVDLVKPVVDAAKVELDALRQKTKSSDAVEAAKAKKDLEAKSSEYVRKLFEASVSDPRVLMVETSNGPKFIYVADKYGGVDVPKAVQEKIKHYMESLKEAGGNELSARILTHSEGHIIATPADIGRTLGKKVQKIINCKKASLAPAGILSFSSASYEYSSSLWFNTAGACPRLNPELKNLRDALFPLSVAGGGTKPDARLSLAQQQIVDGFKANLQGESRKVFESVYSSMNRPLDLIERQQVISGKGKDPRITELIANVNGLVQTNGYDAVKNDVDLRLKYAIALDPSLPPTLRPFDAHGALFDAAFVPINSKIAYHRNNEKVLKAQGDTEGASIARQNGKDAERSYREDIINQLTTLERPLSQSEFSFIFERYAMADADEIAFLKKTNTEWRAYADKAALKSSRGMLNLESSTSRSFQEWGRGSSQTAYLLRLQGPSWQRAQFINKVGESDFKQTEFFEQDFYKQGVKDGHFPEVFGVVRHDKRSLVVQDMILGTQVAIIITRDKAGRVQNKDEFEKVSRGLGKADAELAVLSAKQDPLDSKEIEVFLNTDVDAVNVIWNGERIVFIDYAVEGNSRQRLDDYLLYMFIIRLRELQDGFTKEYLPSMRDAFAAKGPKYVAAFDTAIGRLKSVTASDTEYKSRMSRIMGRLDFQKKLFLVKAWVIEALGAQRKSGYISFTRTDDVKLLNLQLMRLPPP